MAKEERQKEGSVDGGGQGDKVSCRVCAPKETAFQRQNERHEEGRKRDFESARCRKEEERWRTGVQWFII